ncbi:hypothetical protein [Metallibacterium sp.]|uniref:hypothetical protein n=1 Tax=Metallibacterium sp. TaxID=2940281 RepID=UPI0026137CDC|nr:hypothetical protein [Metallibacterium sp.]
MQLFRGVLASRMAVRGITDYDEGLGTFLHDCDQLCMADGLTFAQSVQYRARVKAAKLGTVDNRGARRVDAGEIEAAASAYRQVRTSGGSAAAGSSDTSGGYAP